MKYFIKVTSVCLLLFSFINQTSSQSNNAFTVEFGAGYNYYNYYLSNDVKNSRYNIQKRLKNSFSISAQILLNLDTKRFYPSCTLQYINNELYTNLYDLVFPSDILNNTSSSLSATRINNSIGVGLGFEYLLNDNFRLGLHLTDNILLDTTIEETWYYGFDNSFDYNILSLRKHNLGINVNSKYFIGKPKRIFVNIILSYEFQEKQFLSLLRGRSYSAGLLFGYKL